MAESEGTAEIETSAAEVAAAAEASARAVAGKGDDVRPDDDAADVSPEGGDLEGEDIEGLDEETEPEPPRRRLVAELLEGDEDIEDLPTPDAQLVAPPLHVEPVDAGQPIYQLDLSSDEPQGVIVAPETFEGAEQVLAQGDAYQPAGAAHGGAHQAVRQLIVDRERRVMAAERDGIGAYDLAVELDDFVYALIDALRRVGE